PRTALSYARRAVALQRALGNSQGEHQSLEDVVAAEIDLAETAQALPAALEILRFNRNTGNERGTAASFGRVGVVLAKAHRYAEAKSYYEQELKLREKERDRSAQDFVHAELADVDIHLNRPSEALSHIRHAEAIEASLRAD